MDRDKELDSDKEPKFFDTTREVLERPKREHLFMVAWIVAILVMNATAPDIIVGPVSWVALVGLVVVVFWHWRAKLRWLRRQSEVGARKARDLRVR